MKLHEMKLGKKHPRYDRRTLLLSRYIQHLAPAPAAMGYIDKVEKISPNWGMMLNDSIGDCTIACAGHMIMQWTAFTNKFFEPQDSQILKAYEAVSGFNPSDPSSDNGAFILDVLKYWRVNGIGSHKIAGFAAVNPRNHAEIKQAVALFGNCYIGVGLPISAQNAPTGGNGLPVWQAFPQGPVGEGAPYSWGGHAIPIVGYGQDNTPQAGVEVVSWGQRFDVTWKFMDAYCDEAWAVVSTDWVAASGVDINGFDLSQLIADLTLLQAEGA